MFEKPPVFEKRLEDQKNFESDQKAVGGKEIVAEAYEEFLNKILKKASPEEAEKIQSAYNEFIKIAEEVYEEKGGNASTKDIKERIPDNLWLEMIGSLRPKGLPADFKGPDFDTVWEKHKERENEEDLEEAKRKNLIN